jgi:predicted GNAT superfamily acetyltransferase
MTAEMSEDQIRECSTIEEFDGCVRLQREVFGLPDLEITPRRHLIVSRESGGWTLGAFVAAKLVGFVHYLAALRGEEVIGYSHMLAVDRDYQNSGVGARLKWAQRERALAEGRNFIRWTWDPMQSRNAHFNLNRLGVVVRKYAENFYGTDYVTDPAQGEEPKGLDSDRLFASWDLNSPRVSQLARGEDPSPLGDPASAIAIPSNWTELVKKDPKRARQEQLRVRHEFEQALTQRLVCRAFVRGKDQADQTDQPRYLFYSAEVL